MSSVGTFEDVVPDVTESHCLKVILRQDFGRLCQKTVHLKGMQWF